MNKKIMGKDLSVWTFAMKFLNFLKGTYSPGLATANPDNISCDNTASHVANLGLFCITTFLRPMTQNLVLCDSQGMLAPLACNGQPRIQMTFHDAHFSPITTADLILERVIPEFTIK